MQNNNTEEMSNEELEKTADQFLEILNANHPDEENNLTEQTAEDFMDNDMIPDNILVPVYYAENDKGRIVYDIEEMRQEFMRLLDILEAKSGEHYHDDDTHDEEEEETEELIED